MSVQDLDPQLVIAPSTDVPAPASVALVVEGTNVKAIVAEPTTTGPNPITSFRLYKAPSQSGPWGDVIDERTRNEIAAHHHLYDEDPAFGRATWYAATSVDSTGVESAQTAVGPISPAPPQ